MKKISFFFFNILLFMFTFNPIAFATDVTLTWDRVSQGAPDGYKIHYGTKSRNYTEVIDVGNVAIYTITGLQSGKAYYFAVTAYNEYGESGYSTEVTSMPLNIVSRAQMAIFIGKNVYGRTYDPPMATGLFVDVPVNYWAAEWIEQLYADGITEGCSTNPLQYCPEIPTSRDQMAVFLLKSKHGDNYKPPSATGVFADVPDNHWAADWIEQLYAEGITEGCGTNPRRFCPSDSVTRAQMAVFLLTTKHGANYTPPAAKGIFADVPVSHWAADWIERLYAEGITKGCGTNPLRFCP